MATKWTSERNERLLLLTVQDIKIDAKKLAQAWSEQYGSDSFQPTPRAIQEQFGTLKKKAGGKSGAAKQVNGVSTPKTPRTINKETPTPRKSAAGKSTITPSKRKKCTMSDDESALDDDDDSEIDLKNFKADTLSSRASLTRTKKIPTRYQESNDSEEGKADDEGDYVPLPINGSGIAKAEGAGGEAAAAAAVAADSVMGEGDEIHVAATPKAKTNGLASKMSGLMANGGAKNTAGLRFAESEMEDESDVSDFAKSSG